MYKYFSLIIIFLSTHLALAAASPTSDSLPIIAYIEKSWGDLGRSTFDCESLKDKLTGTKTILYLPKGYADSRLDSLRNCNVETQYLPHKINRLGDINIKRLPKGILYLPHAYVVPGGMFNEMYGWDSYFIILGLLESGKLSVAEGMLDNLFFEIKHYGGVLNANRSYYLTRSQPPFLTSIIKAIYQKNIRLHQESITWLKRAYTFAKRDYDFWTSGAHLAGTTGLSRYYDFDHGPVPELLSTNIYYQKALDYFQANPVGNKSLLNGDKLSEHFYEGDRAMRESGYDTSFRFGPFSGHTTDYAPVELNSLLYKAENDLAWISHQLKNHKDEKEWHSKAEQRKININNYFWNEKVGLFLDYNFITQKQSDYQYLTTYFPLWAGVATAEQAAKVLQNLHKFEQAHGLTMSANESGAQWDAPYGWAPLHLIAVEGLLHYEFQKDAKRVAMKFMHTIRHHFKQYHVIVEKYNVVTGLADTEIKYGYASNEIGFGWTNGVYLRLLKIFSQDGV